jgi:large subunit ribosomal protein L23
MSKDIYSVLKKPLLTEKSLDLRDEVNRYSFEVDSSANKADVKRAVEKLFKVKVQKVCTTTLPGKIKSMGRYQGRRPSCKKAIVTLKKGDKIDMETA